MVTVPQKKQRAGTGDFQETNRGESLLPGPPAEEESIVWLENPAIIGPYVREIVIYCRRRRARPGWRGPGRLVAYSVLRPEVESSNGAFLRRVWYLADWDPYEGGGCPCEAVDPMSVAVNQASESPRRRPQGTALAPCMPAAPARQ